MKISWILFAALLFVALVGARAGQVETDENNNGSEHGGSKTWNAIKQFFRPMTNYFRGLPQKTPSDVATDVKGTVTDFKEWAKENDAIQALMSSLVPVKRWLKEKAGSLEDKTFRDVYEDVKTRVGALYDQEKAGSLEDKTFRDVYEDVKTRVGALYDQEKAGSLEDKTFRDVYEDVKTRVGALYDQVGQWIQDRNKKAME